MPASPSDSGTRERSPLQRLGSVLAAHLFLALILLLSWLLPGSSLLASAADARSIMILESVLLFASVLVGNLVQVSYVAFPLLIGALLVWLASAGRAGFSLAMLGFVWALIAAFLEGLRAHRGEFGAARLNPDHPHRRYDRVVLIWLACLPVFVTFWLSGRDDAWRLWASVYFIAVALGDSLLQAPIDRIPRTILKRMQANIDPAIKARIGLCADCVYVQPALPAKPGRDVRCVLSTQDKRFPEYPPTPLASCAGFVKRD